MGAFDIIPNLSIPDDEGDPKGAAAFREKYGWEPHEIVILRGSFTAGMQEEIGNVSMETDKKGTPHFLGGSGRIKLLECMIVDWTLSSNGRRVPISYESIKRLPASYSNPLLEKCDELAAAMTEEEQEDFFASANGHTTDAYTETSRSHSH